jgi:ABC-type Fe3+ transport system permease subunit
MIRVLIEETLLFLIPFAVFLLWLAVRKRNPFKKEAWQGASFWLAVAGIMIGIAAIIYTGFTQERGQGGYIPPHVENGRVVPGQFR